eukprot:770353-Prymnesium_polylepis.1
MAQRAEQELSIHNEQQLSLMAKQLQDERSNGTKMVELCERSEQKLGSVVEALATCQAQLDGRMRQL